MKQYKIITIVMLIFSLLVSGCSSSSKQNRDDNYAAADYGYYEDYMVGDMMEMDEMAYVSNDSTAAYSKAVPAAADTEAPAQKRMIQKSASINIQVMDPLDAAAKINELTEQMGGFVVSSSSSQEYYNSETYLPKANLTIRVPAERLNEMLEFIENLTGDTSKYVSNKRVYGTDITSEYVDTSSRLTSLEKTRDKLYEIMDTAENAEEALEVYNRIAEVESDIEVYKGQIKYMEESVALSSIDIQISSIRPAPIRTVQGWSLGDVISDAFETLLDVGKGLIEFLIRFIIVIVPMIILIAIPVILIVFIIRKLIKNKNNQTKGSGSDKHDEDPLTEINKK